MLLTRACELHQVVELKPDWPKGYSRLGAARQGLKQWDEAATAYEKGMVLPACYAQQAGVSYGRARVLVHLSASALLSSPLLLSSMTIHV